MVYKLISVAIALAILHTYGGKGIAVALALVMAYHVWHRIKTGFWLF